MLQAILDQFQTLLGLQRDVANVGALQMALRTIIIYAFTLAIVRLGSKRFLGQASAFDSIIGIMIGSVMSHAISIVPFKQQPHVINVSVYEGVQTVRVELR